MDFSESETGPSELLDRVGTFCSLERSEVEEQNKVLGMLNPVYHVPIRATIVSALA